ncbi:Cytochrome c oxidase copper chaperone [Saxophila tyrrhenica]|uniref:Cytochrome c oxidase copper chaperone n=1 Tax=Saxophila tyrrhenica TaxID=1690608 RepID=A0AAV9PJX5_9PEZI|nr:Cytochrome c oxidase copper chaperone [Saxophila tyrrhenica]
MSTKAASPLSSNPPQPNNLAADLKPQGNEGAPKVKPCCVCKDEKSARDECMLFSNASDPQDACKDLVGKYRSCMASYGFNMA